jgi:hypothetical protein
MRFFRRKRRAELVEDCGLLMALTESPHTQVSNRACELLWELNRRGQHLEACSEAEPGLMWWRTEMVAVVRAEISARGVGPVGP